MLKLVFTCLLLASSIPALAVYKCESGGTVSYTDAPCTNGTAVQLPDQPPATPAEITRASKENVARQKTVTAMEKTRHQQEAVAEKQQQRAAKSAAAQRKHCTTLSLRKKWADEDASHAVGKAVEKARLRARRTGEQFDAECKGF